MLKSRYKENEDRPLTNALAGAIEDCEEFLRSTIKSGDFTFDKDDWDEFEEEFHDSAMEIADSHTPIYYGDILACAQEDLGIALSNPGTYAFDGKQTPMNGMAGNVYELIWQTCWDTWEEYKSYAEQGEFHMIEYQLGIKSPKKKNSNQIKKDKGTT